MKSVFAKYKRIIIASYRQPFHTTVIDNNPVIQQNSGGLVSAVVSLYEKYCLCEGTAPDEKIIWVGKGEPDEIPGTYPNRGDNHLHTESVMIDDAMDKLYYAGFANKLIWPLFHYFHNYAVYNDTFFDAYQAAQHLFADKIASIVTEGDFIWIHDYQLMLLPGILRERLPEASIGFFLHIPFPTFETFRMMKRSWREAILRGILGADLAGFQINDHAQYFLRAVSRTLGNEISPDTVISDGRIIRVATFPIGIDYEKFNNASDSITVQKQIETIKPWLKDTRLIFSIDRLDYTKGFINRLTGYELFLERYPEWRGVVVFNMIVIPSRSTIGSYQEMKREIESHVGRINGKYSTISWRPIIYQYRTVPFDELVALYRLSDVALITPLRDGMNLVCKEYVACQHHNNGVLILSEMAGAADELSDAFLINPIDTDEMAMTINKALLCPFRERGIRMNQMRTRLKNYDIFSWTKDFMGSIEKIKEEQNLRRIKVMDSRIEKKIVTDYYCSSSRIIFLDYDGTLVPFSRFPDLAIPSEQTISIIRRLADDRRNLVVIISGRVRSFLEEHFGLLNVHLVAEHGAYVKYPHEQWVCTADNRQEWKIPIFWLLQRYSDHCAGSFIEEKDTSLAWHYRNAVAEQATLATNQLREDLRSIIGNNTRLCMVEGNKVIEVRVAGFDKGYAALNYIRARETDFILAVGDDKTDEDLFRVLPPNAVTVKVGLTASLARYNLRNQSEVSRFVSQLLPLSEL